MAKFTHTLAVLVIVGALAALVSCSAPDLTKKRQSYYRILGVENNAEPKEIKRSFMKLAKAYHPDKNSDEETRDLFFR